ncbi:MAG: phosphate/phosphite/phosphonate ABC transporter substrate-binding protein [Candidatus Ozemobacteraceae bacterium]
MKSGVFRAFLLVACFLSLTFHAGAVQAVASEAQPAASHTLTLGMILYTDASSQQEAIAPLAEYLGKRLGMEVNIHFFHDYYGILNEIDHESLDLALLSPVIYSLLMDESAIKFVGVPLERDQMFYHSVILTNKDSGIASIASLAGRKIGFVDIYSASGYLVPAGFLADEGLLATGPRSYSPVFLGSHGKAVRALLEKKVDAICTYDTFFDFTNHQLGEYKNLSLDSFNLLKLLPERIPADTLVCRTMLGKDVLAKLQEALRDFHRAREEAGSPLQKVSYTGFQVQPGEGYRSLKTRLTTLMESSPAKEKSAK